MCCIADCNPKGSDPKTWRICPECEDGFYEPEPKRSYAVISMVCAVITTAVVVGFYMGWW